MNLAKESRLIQEAVVATFRDAGMAWPPAAAGPIPLGDLIAELPVVHKEVDGLNRAAAAAMLRHWDVRWSETARDDPPLAGFIYADSRRGFIFVRRGDILPRRRFTAAHELGHFRLHLEQALGRGESQMVTVDRDEDVNESDPREPDQLEVATMERQANRFAAELLMPEPVCRARFERHSRQYGAVDRFLVYHLAADLLVSRTAIAWRLHGLGLIDRPAWLAGAVQPSVPAPSPTAEVG